MNIEDKENFKSFQNNRDYITQDDNYIIPEEKSKNLDNTMYDCENYVQADMDMIDDQETNIEMEDDGTLDP